MPITLSWRTSFSASCLHAAAAIVRGEALADARLAGALAEPTMLLQGEIEANGLPAGRFWQHLIGLAATTESDRQLVQTALIKAIGRGKAADIAEQRLTAAVTGVEAAVSREFPKLAEELPLRMGPLRGQWEARGPGFLRRVGLLTDESLLIEQADVVVLHPALGGGGEAYLPANQVRIEGVLANPCPELPEVVRLGWLLAQLDLDLPQYSETIHPDRLPQVATLALLPVALQAGQDVELCQASPGLLAQALGAWRLSAAAHIDPSLVTEWWETYRETRPPFAVALVALDKMLVM